MAIKTLIGSTVFAVCIGTGFAATAQVAPSTTPSTSPGSITSPTTPGSLTSPTTPGSITSPTTPGSIRPSSTPPDIFAPNVPNGIAPYPRSTFPNSGRTTAPGQINPPERIYDPSIGNPRRTNTPGSFSVPGTRPSPQF